jgi:hypothetical protein
MMLRKASLNIWEMGNEFVTYEQALALKELGFDDECCGFYSDNILYIYEIENKNLCDGAIVCALKQQVFRWFREKHECYANLSSWIHEEELGIYHEFEIYRVKQYSHGSIRFNTYEEAENACIDKLIEIAKQ